MKKLLLPLLLLAAVFCGFGLAKLFSGERLGDGAGPKPKKAILRAALVADVHNDRDLLEKALRQAQGMGVNFVIGLGDYSNVGTVDELTAVKNVLEGPKIPYFVTAGDRDLWDSRNRGEEALANFKQIFGPSEQTFERSGVRFVILDNADIYKGISADGWEILGEVTKVTKEPKEPVTSKLLFVLAHKTPYHPQSAHIMGEQSEEVKSQANRLIQLIEQKKVDGFFSGDLHFFAKYNSPAGSVKMTTIGAVTGTPNPQGPRFGVLTVFDDYTWDVGDVEIR